jgi:hypothetical protein
MECKTIETGRVEAKGFDGTVLEYDYILERESQTDYQDDETISYTFLIHKDDGVFTFKLEDEEVRLRVTWIGHDHHPSLKGKGIAAALIQQAFKSIKSPLFPLQIIKNTGSIPLPVRSPERGFFGSLASVRYGGNWWITMLLLTAGSRICSFTRRLPLRLIVFPLRLNWV